MDMYLTLDEAIEAAREAYLADHENSDDASQVAQFNLQKYVMQDGEIMWLAEFHATEDEGGDGVPLFNGEAAQAIFDNDYDEVEIREEWITENTLYEWDEDDFQYEPPLDTEEGEAASDEWEEQN
ncbi:secY/secA suppressor protein [Obesumbacterium proteus]|nr:secY/secA suppressor protein [Obesumbacterium proteus]